MDPTPTLPFSKTAPSEDHHLKRAVGNWNNLNIFLRESLSITQLQQMMNIEATREGGPRGPIVERLFAKWVKAQRARVYRVMGLKVEPRRWVAPPVSETEPVNDPLQ